MSLIFALTFTFSLIGLVSWIYTLIEDQRRFKALSKALRGDLSTMDPVSRRLMESFTSRQVGMVKKDLESGRAEELRAMAVEMAREIRSPLSLLAMMTSHAEKTGDRVNHVLLGQVVSRMNSTADGVLQKYGVPAADRVAVVAPRKEPKRRSLLRKKRVG